MNNENKNVYINYADEDFSAEELTLAPNTALLEEAKAIAENTKADKKYPFDLQYDANQKDFLLSILNTVGAIVENDNCETRVLSTFMNMSQLAFIKRLECVQKVKTDEGSNMFLGYEIESSHPAVAETTQT